MNLHVITRRERVNDRYSELTIKIWDEDVDEDDCYYCYLYIWVKRSISYPYINHRVATFFTFQSLQYTKWNRTNFEKLRWDAAPVIQVVFFSLNFVQHLLLNFAFISFVQIKFYGKWNPSDFQSVSLRVRRIVPFHFSYICNGMRLFMDWISPMFVYVLNTGM